MKLLGHMRLQKLDDVTDLLALDMSVVDISKNAEVHAELIQFLDDHSLSLVMCDAKNDGQ